MLFRFLVLLLILITYSCKIGGEVTVSEEGSDSDKTVKVALVFPERDFKRSSSYVFDVDIYVCEAYSNCDIFSFKDLSGGSHSLEVKVPYGEDIFIEAIVFQRESINNLEDSSLKFPIYKGYGYFNITETTTSVSINMVKTYYGDASNATYPEVLVNAVFANEKVLSDKILVYPVLLSSIYNNELLSSFEDFSIPGENQPVLDYWLYSYSKYYWIYNILFFSSYFIKDKYEFDFVEPKQSLTEYIRNVLYNSDNFEWYYQCLGNLFEIYYDESYAKILREVNTLCLEDSGDSYKYYLLSSTFNVHIFEVDKDFRVIGNSTARADKSIEIILGENDTCYMDPYPISLLRKVDNNTYIPFLVYPGCDVNYFYVYYNSTIFSNILLPEFYSEMSNDFVIYYLFNKFLNSSLDSYVINLKKNYNFTFSVTGDNMSLIYARLMQNDFFSVGEKIVGPKFYKDMFLVASDFYYDYPGYLPQFCMLDFRFDIAKLLLVSNSTLINGTMSMNFMFDNSSSIDLDGKILRIGVLIADGHFYEREEKLTANVSNVSINVPDVNLTADVVGNYLKVSFNGSEADLIDKCDIFFIDNKIKDEFLWNIVDNCLIYNLMLADNSCMLVDVPVTNNELIVPRNCIEGQQYAVIRCYSEDETLSVTRILDVETGEYLFSSK